MSSNKTGFAASMYSPPIGTNHQLPALLKHLHWTKSLKCTEQESSLWNRVRNLITVTVKSLRYQHLNMSNFFYAGLKPSCSGLAACLVSCTTDQVTHFHVINGGRRLNNLLEPEPEQGEIPNECVRNFCQLMMASNGKMKEEIHQLYWQCKNCHNIDGVSPILEPDAGFCLKCSEDKLASAEQVVMALSQDILNTWREEQTEPASNVNYKMLTGRDLRDLAYSPHKREGSGLIEKAWVDPRGMITSDGCGGYVQLYGPVSCFCSPIHTEKSMYQWKGA